jgi:hypothetical protein
MVKVPVNTFSRLKSFVSPALPSAALDHPPWDYGIVVILQLGTPPEHYPSNWPSRGGVFSCVHIPGWIPRGQAMTTALFGPWPDLSMHSAGVVPVLDSSSVAGSAVGVIVAVTIIHKIRRWGHLCHQVLTTAIAVQQKQFCLNCHAWVMVGDSGYHHFYSSYTWS